MLASSAATVLYVAAVTTLTLTTAGCKPITSNINPSILWQHTVKNQMQVSFNVLISLCHLKSKLAQNIVEKISERFPYTKTKWQRNLRHNYRSYVSK
jgi:hypothetical protein